MNIQPFTYICIFHPEMHVAFIIGLVTAQKAAMHVRSFSKDKTHSLEFL